MGAVRAQIILHTADNFAANYVTNSIAFQGTDPIADVAAIRTAVKGFYDALGASFFSSAIAQNGHEIKYYDLPGIKPNYPVLEQTFNLNSVPNGAPLPSEVALCLSFQGQRVPGFPQSRRRGRIYLGPLGATVNNAGRPNSSSITTVCNAATAFKTAIDAIGTGTEWAIWSVRDQTTVDIVGGWVDNVFDTQRRRGVAETSRTTWS
jgi:hypothetical protein